MSSHERIPVGVLGATGAVGQRFVSLLAAHPWFELAVVMGSERSVGKRYSEVVQWMLAGPLPQWIGAMKVQPLDSLTSSCPVLFSALDQEVAGELEIKLATAGHIIVSNAGSHRMDSDVPLIVPEVKPDHLALLRRQTFGDGAIITSPNCSTIGLVLALKPLVDAFGLEAVHVVTLQALSGAGLPGVPGIHCLDNIIPFISGEEEKLETETKKILGVLHGGSVRPADLTLSAQCTRVSVLDGHTECVSVGLKDAPSLEDVREAFIKFNAAPGVRRLPSAPSQLIVLTSLPDRPQPRLDRDRGNGMSVTVGRLRRCPLLDFKFVLLTHNTLRGAAGGAILVAELAMTSGLLSCRGMAVGSTRDEN